MPKNEAEGISIKDPRNYVDRVNVAEKACVNLKINIPCLVDQLDDLVNTNYSAWPDRIYCIDRDGKIAVKGGQGPFGFAPSLDQTETWLKTLRSN